MKVWGAQNAPPESKRGFMGTVWGGKEVELFPVSPVGFSPSPFPWH